MAIRIVIADDQRLVRHTFRHILTSDPEFQVVGCAADGAEALRLCLEHWPDVALLDLSMPGVDGLETARELRERAPGTRVVMLTLHEEPHRVEEAARAGVAAYLLKDASPADLIRIVKAVHRGEAAASPHLAAPLPERPRG